VEASCLEGRRFIANSPPAAGASTAGYFSPTSVQFKSEINDAPPRKRHQKRPLDFYTAHLLSRMSWVRVPPGAPLHFIFNELWVKAFLSDRLLFRQMDRHDGIKLFFSLLLLIQLFA